MIRSWNPFTYRPEIDDNEEVEWEDNWLSNAFAWFSDLLTPKGCETHGAVMATISNYLWTSCPCCLFWRGAVFGAFIPTIAIVLFAVAMYVF